MAGCIRRRECPGQGEKWELSELILAESRERTVGNLGNTQWIVAVFFALLAGLTDWRSRRIPNWLTVPGFMAGVAIYGVGGSWNGVLASLAGAGSMLGILLPVVLLRGLGAGDWKLMGALGAILGRNRILEVLLASVFMAGALAIVQMVRRRQVKQTLVNLWELVRGFFIFGLRPNTEINLDNPAASSVPFGVATAVATMFCYGFGMMTH